MPSFRRLPRIARAATPIAPQTLTITAVGAAGDGIGLAPDGSRVFVPYALPGEEVLAIPLASRGGGMAACLERIDTPSPDRIPPACPHFTICGGCALQHWATAPYLAWKSGLLRDALIRAGFPDPELAPIVATPPGARRRMDLAVARDPRERGPAALRLGLHPAHGGPPVDLVACPVLHPALVGLIAPLRALLAPLALVRREGSAVANLLDNGPDLLLRTDAAPTQADRAQLIAFARAHRLARISWGPGGSAHRAEPPEPIAILHPPRLTLAGIQVAPPPGAFLQASAEGEAAIGAAVLAALPDKLPPRARIEELHAGIGTLTFALAARAEGRIRVRAWDSDAAALAALRQAAAASGLAGRIETIPRDLDRRPLAPADLAGAAAVVLDPPHAGAAAQMAALAAAGPPIVIYVSCNPATLARDAAILREAGYRLAAATPIDQFLWSARLESVVVFHRAPRRGP